MKAAVKRKTRGCKLAISSKERMTRRTFVKSSALAGMAATLPGWMTGCLPSDTLPEGRERRTLHFDFSHLEPGGEYTLRVLRSTADKSTLQEHTDETRARFRSGNSLLQQIPDERLTHYVEDVDFPADAVQHWWVTTPSENGVPAIVTSQLHIPHHSIKDLVASRKSRVVKGRISSVIDESTHAKLQYLGAE